VRPPDAPHVEVADLNNLCQAEDARSGWVPQLIEADGHQAAHKRHNGIAIQGRTRHIHLEEAMACTQAVWLLARKAAADTVKQLAAATATSAQQLSHNQAATRVLPWCIK
jgi:hypothetical protein